MGQNDGEASSAEARRLQEARERHVPWRKWGPYSSERQWGTVREDYSDDGDAWNYFSHDQVRWRAYRWGEDGWAGISDNHQVLCLALAVVDHDFAKNMFAGGFLGLDNIGVFDRSAPLPTGGYLEQADGTTQNTAELAVELASHDPTYEVLAGKFIDHFCWIAAAMHRPGDDSMWDEEDGFYYDLLRLPDGGAGLGASHQTGWTGLVGALIHLFGRLVPQRALEVGKMAAFARGEAKE